MKTNISVIVPVRNLSECIVPFYYELIKHIPPSFELIWVNNCSIDTTAEEIMTIIERDKRVRCITLKKEEGREAAVIAGLDYAHGDYLFIMKGDLQHPADMIPQMIRKLDEGYDIVHTIPGNRASVSLPQKWIMDVCYHALSLLKRKDVLIHMNQLRGFKKKVVIDMLFSRENDFSDDTYFCWSRYHIATMEYYNKLNKEKHRKYSKAHLLNTAGETFDYTIPEFTKTIFYLGVTLSLASLFFFLQYMIEFVNGNRLHTDALSMTSLLFAGGLQILLFGTHKKKINSAFLQFYKRHKQAVEQNDFLTDYSFGGKQKEHALIES